MVLTISTFILAFILFPFPQLPKPTGEYKIGVKTFHLIDDSRKEPFTERINDYRELMVDVWYPIDKELTATPISYPNALGNVAANIAKLPTFLFEYFTYTETDMYVNTPISTQEESYPVIIFSHGDSATRYQNIALVRELVSHGYIVVGIDHTYNAGYTVFPDGRVALRDKAFQLVGGDEGMIKTRVLDISFLINEMEKWDETDPIFKNAINEKRIGALGHSLGGSTVAEALIAEKRIIAGINMDGRVYENVTTTNIGKPFMHMMGEQSLNNGDYVQFNRNQFSSDEEYEEMLKHMRLFSSSFSITYNHQVKDAYKMEIKGASHYDFTDGPFFISLFGGSISIQRAHEIISNASLSFFNRYLKENNINIVEQVKERDVIIEGK